ncbi:uncharacterized protein V1516DRAFT_678429 [Lipomyces oligophaga]|uniref:uncharacterized protein n=1 Tax=Lipomyces oligophaga TaxID=45792 RepID=UPI0034CF0CBE
MSSGSANSRPRRPSVFSADLSPNSRNPISIHSSRATGSATGQEEVSNRIELSTSPSSIASSTLLDHRPYQQYAPPSSGGPGTGSSHLSRRLSMSGKGSSSMQASAAAATSLDVDSDDEDTPLINSKSGLSKTTSRGRKADSIAAEHDRYVRRQQHINSSATRDESFLVDIGEIPSAYHIDADARSQLDDEDSNNRSSSRRAANSAAGDLEGDREYGFDRSRAISSASLDDVCVPFEANIFDDPSRPHQTSKSWPDTCALEEWAESEMAAAAVEAGAPELVMVDGRPRYISEGLGNTSGANIAGPSYYLEDNTAAIFQGRRRGGPREPSRPPFERLGYSYRFTYFREDVEKTIHAQNLSGLLGHGLSFAELFPASMDLTQVSSVHTASQTPSNEDVSELTVNDEKKTVEDPIKMSDAQPVTVAPTPIVPLATAKFVNSDQPGPNLDSIKRLQQSRSPSYFTSAPSRTESAAGGASKGTSQIGDETPCPFWLDILDPTDAEMKVISKAFGIHPLTTEDICMEETREKVELFKSYYLVCFRSFEIEPHMSARELRRRYGRDAHKRRSYFGKKGDLVPVNMYIVVFRDGVLSFHFRPAPHPANVRRRIRQLKDYVTISADWISYAIIDNVTDSFAPLIGEIEEEVQDIESEILDMNSAANSEQEDDDEWPGSDDEGDEMDHKLRRRRTRGEGDSASLFSIRTGAAARQLEAQHRGDMLRRIGECRKQVMSVMRLLGFKADVIKGFAKRCNEQWQVAPRSEIGLYLGDIQDHIITMVQNLTHYEKLLSRSHSNYLAQINLDMTRVNNETNDVLGRLTILGTIVLPMNIITGLWGMNVYVPGQEAPGLAWFYSSKLCGYLVY